MLIRAQNGNIVNFDNFDTITYELHCDDTIDMYIEIYASKKDSYVVLGEYQPWIDDYIKERAYDNVEFRDKLFRSMRKSLRQSATETLEHIYHELKRNGYYEMDKDDSLVGVDVV